MMVSQKVRKTVTPAQAGVQNLLKTLDSRLRGNDRRREISTFYEVVINEQVTALPGAKVARFERIIDHCALYILK